MEPYLYKDLYELEDTHWWHRAKKQLVRESLEKFFTPKSHSKLLDVGCGTGKILELLSNYGDAVGVDSSPEALAFCQQRQLKQVYLTDIEKNLPFSADTFDVITLLDVLEHIEEQPALTEIFRVLKPGGLLIVMVPALPWLWSGWDVVLHHRRRYTKQTLKEALRTRQFQVRKTSYVYSFLVLPVLIVRWWKTRTAAKYGSDFQLGNTITSWILQTLSGLERWLLWKVGIFIGTSVFAVCQKPIKKESNG